MFTGIAEEVGKVQSITNDKICIQAEKVLNDINLGDSIAINGICLTVTSFNENSFYADISPETVKSTAIESLSKNSFVNLERAMPINGRLGGHIVSGHVDGKCKITNLKKEGEFHIIELKLTPETFKYVVKKGSIAINGISLTVADINKDTIKIAIIPHTYENTNLKTLKTGDFVNIETDILARYVEKFLSTSDNRTGISMEFLMENGF